MAKKRKDDDGTGDRPGNGNMYALLVGINEYANISDLSGCIKDLDRIEDFLKRFWNVQGEGGKSTAPIPNTTWGIPNSLDLGYEMLRIVRLEDEAATYDKIIGAFRTFLKQAGGNDCVWFHFSGHGSEAPSAPEFATVENGRDQGLMCTDYAINLTDGDLNFGRYTGFLADKELRILLDELTAGAEGAPEILVTLDSCHSGGGTRDGEFPTVRTIAVDESAAPRPLDDYHLGRFTGQITADTPNLPNPPHIILTACDNHELAAERGGGLFTTSLINVLDSVPGPGIISYADLLIRVRAAVRAKNRMQTPQFEAFGDSDAYSSFIQGFPEGDPDLYEVKVKQGKWTVAIGAIHGLPTTAEMQRLATARSQPFQLEIYAPDTSGGSSGGGTRSGGQTDNSNTAVQGSGNQSVGNLGAQQSTLEFRRSNFGVKLHLVDFLPGTSDESLEGALVRKVSDQYSVIDFRQADFGMRVEVFSDKAQPTEGPLVIDPGNSLPGPVTPGPRVLVDPPNQPISSEPIGIAEIEEIGPFFSTLKLPEGVDMRSNASYYGVLNYMPVQPEAVLVSGDEAAVESFIMAQADFAKIGARNVHLLSTEDELMPHELEVVIGEDSISIKDLRSGTPVDRTYETSDPTSVFKDLIQIVNWRRMIALENKDLESQLKDKVSVELRIGNDTARESFTPQNGKIQYTAEDAKKFKADNLAPDDLYYRFDLELNLDVPEDQELFYYLFLLDPSYRILGEAERKKTGAGELTYLELPKWGLDEGENASDLYLKVLVTSQPIDAHQFKQDGIGPDRGELISPQLLVETGFADWTTLTVKVEMTRAVRTRDGEPEQPDSEDEETDTEVIQTIEPLKNWESRPEFRQSHAIVIGIDEYPGLKANLGNAVSDAKKIALRLKLLQNFDNVLLMTNVSKAQIETLLEWLQELRHSAPDIPNQTFRDGNHSYTSQIGWLKRKSEFASDQDLSRLPVLELTVDDGPASSRTERVYLLSASETAIQSSDGPIIQANDSIVFYYAGHGRKGEKATGPPGYLAPTDAEDSLVDFSSLLSMNEVYWALSDSRRRQPDVDRSTYECRHTLMILDCCFAGQFRFSESDPHRGMLRPYLLPLHEGRYRQYVSGNAWQVLASAGPEETAADSASWADVRDQSPFAKTLIDALEGKADRITNLNRGKLHGDGIITATEIYLYVRDGVDRLTGDVRPQHPGLFPMEQHQTGEFIFINPRVSPDSLNNLPPDPEINPYQGLKPYSFADGGRFFGRDTVIRDIIQRLQETDVLFVSGPSGAGKTSLVKAGVFPHLRDIDEWRVVRPSDLTAKVHSTRSEAEEDSSDTSGEETSPTKYVLFFDQYEELFSLPNKEEVLAEIENMFNEAVGNGHKVIFTLRADFEWQVKTSSLKGYWQRENIFRVPPMELEHLREAITGPAWWAMYDFKDNGENDDLDTGEQLINEVISDVVNAPGALPLLSFAMHNFFALAKRENRGNRLLLSDYEDLRGVEGIISREADRMYGTTEPQLRQEMTPKQRMFRQLLLRMVNLYDGAFTRRRVYYNSKETENPSTSQRLYDELRFAKQDDAVLDEVIADLIATNLIVTDVDSKLGITFLEPAHDALINEWDRCRLWLDDFGKETLLLQRRLWEAVLDIQQKELDRLHINTDESDELENLPMFSEEDEGTTSDYWELSPRLDEVTKAILDPHERWLHRLQDADEMLEALAQLLWGQDLAPQQRAKLEASDKMQVADHPLRAYVLGMTERGLGQEISPEALPPGITSVGDLDLLQAIEWQMDNWLNEPELEFVRESWQRRVKRIKQLTDALNEAQAGELAAKASNSKNRKVAFRFAELSEAVVNGNLSGKEQLIRSYHLAKEPPHYSLDDHGSGIGGLTFSRNGELLATSAADNVIRLYDPETGTAVALLSGHRGYIYDLCFWPGIATKLVSASADRSVKIWEKGAGNQWAVAHSIDGHAEEVCSVEVSPNAQYIASGDTIGNLTLWSVNGIEDDTAQTLLDNVQTSELDRDRDITALSFSPDNRRIVTGNKNGEVKVWRIEGDRLEEEVVFPEHNRGEEIYSAWFIDNEHVISGARGRRIWRWKIGANGTEDHVLLAREGTDYHIDSSTLSADEGMMVLCNKVICIHAYDQEQRRPGGVLHEIEVDGPAAHRVAFGKNRTYLAAAIVDTVKVWKLAYEPPRPALSLADEYTLAHGHEFLTEREHRNLAYSADEKLRISALPDKEKIQLYDAEADKDIATFSNSAPIQYLGFGHTNEIFISGDRAGMVKIWRTDDPNPQIEIDTNFGDDPRGITHVTLSPDNRYLLCTTFHTTDLQVWDLEGGDQEEEGPPVIVQRLDVSRARGLKAVEFSPDGRRVVVAGMERLKVYRFANGKLADRPDLVIPEGQTYAHFSPDGSLVLTYDFNNHVKAWEADTGVLRMSFPEIIRSSWAKFTDDGERWLIICRYPENGGISRTMWFDSGALLAAANQDRWMGALTAKEIQLYQLQLFMDRAGYLDGRGDPTPLIEKGNVDMMFKFGQYYLERMDESEDNEQKADLAKKARQLFEVAEAVTEGQIHLPATYQFYTNTLKFFYQELGMDWEENQV